MEAVERKKFIWFEKSRKIFSMSARNLTVHCADIEPVQEVRYQKPVSTKGGVARRTRRPQEQPYSMAMDVGPLFEGGAFK